MTELFLFLIIIALLSYIGVREYFDRKERKLIMRNLMAKNLQEVIQAEALDKANPTVEAEPDLIPTEEMSTDDFFAALRKTNEEEDGQ